MNNAVIFSATLGLCSVFQAGLNRRIASHSGLMSIVVLNNLVVVAAMILYFIFYGKSDVFPKMFLGKNQTFQLIVWSWVPGVMGLALLVGMPFAISKIGALRMLLIFIAAEILGGMFWDSYFEGKTVTSLRALGALVSFLGAALTAYNG